MAREVTVGTPPARRLDLCTGSFGAVERNASLHGPSHDHLYAGSYSEDDLSWGTDRLRELVGPA